MMELCLETCTVRSFRPDDAASIRHHADNPRVAGQLRDAFPHPYTLDDAREFLELVARQGRETDFAIDVDGQAAGAVGFRPGRDIHRCQAEIGYWLGEELWRRGIMSEVVPAMSRWAARELDVIRVFALPFADNRASIRVLEKAGYRLEGRLRCGAVKGGRVRDQLLYAWIRPEESPDPV